MQARYLAVFKLSGYNKLFDDLQSVEFLKFPELGARVILTMDPEEACEHFDRAGVLAFGLLSGSLPSLTTGDGKSIFASLVKERSVARQKKFGTGVYVVFDAKAEVDVPSDPADSSQEFDDFSILFGTDPQPRQAFRSLFRATVQNVIATLGLGVDAKSQRAVSEVGTIVLLYHENEKPTYWFLLSANPLNIYTVPPLTEVELERAKERSIRLGADEALLRTSDLLKESLDSETDGLRAFVAVWVALELFIVTKFRSDYYVNGKKYLQDKFEIIAARLNPEGAVDDVVIFAKLRNVRNQLFHQGSTPRLPTSETQQLLQKYIRLHLDHFR